MSASLGVFRLQQVDRQVDQARARLDAIRKILEDDVELRSALGLAESAQDEKKQAQRDLHAAENNVQNQLEKIKQAEGSLYGGSVRNPKELQDLQNEVAALKRHLTTLEERQLEAMLRMESAELQLKSAEAQLAGLQTRLGDQHGALLEEKTALSKDLERLQAERQAIVSALAIQALDKYENLRLQRRGTAVAEIHESSCSACGTLLTAALQQNARSTTQMAHCPSCGRILYAD